MSSILITIDEILEATKGKLLQKQDSFVYGVSTDSRSIQKGDLFIPLKGENFDGHDYLSDVVKKNAGCILTSQKLPEGLNVTAIEVKDTLQALQDLSVFYRKNLKAKIICITGSNGKTTTKFFTESILKTKYKTYASQKSFNNHIGVPLTLLALSQETEFGIVEVGMNHPGEIAALTKIANPDVALVTTVGRAHLMDFGSVEKIAHEKGDLYKYSRGETIKVFNLDNPECEKLFAEYGSHRRIAFSSFHNSEVHFEILEMTLHSLKIKGQIKGISGEVQIPVFGKQNLTNLMGAASIALACGMSPVDIWKGLQECKTVWGRNMLIDLPQNAHMIFDGYNANPDSMKALIENLADLNVKKKKIVILGDMLELGDLSAPMHVELGRLVAEKNFDVVLFVGQFCRDFESGIKASKFNKSLMISNSYEDSLALKVASMIEPDDIVVIKGSRGSKLERFVPHFKPLNW